MRICWMSPNHWSWLIEDKANITICISVKVCLDLFQLWQERLRIKTQKLGKKTGNYREFYNCSSWRCSWSPKIECTVTCIYLTALFFSFCYPAIHSVSQKQWKSIWRVFFLFLITQEGGVLCFSIILIKVCNDCKIIMKSVPLETQ